MDCVVFRCSRQPEMYLYLRADMPQDALPQDLLRRVGRLTEVMTLQLSPGRRLARADAATVIRQLNAAGYYLQMPPRGQVSARLYQGD